ncbi:endonuclease domain-containing protein [Streptomyces longispororuber]|uniref:endonuclease domain-containing protein n=1 Tax=Streptomyces longispororuber TaxID=68230 RepID=UPI0033F336A6
MSSKRTRRTSCAPSYRRAGSKPSFPSIRRHGAGEGAGRLGDDPPRGRRGPAPGVRPAPSGPRSRHPAVRPARPCCRAGRRRPAGVPTAHVEHGHGTGRVRGVLSRTCNSAIGTSGDEPATRRRAMNYLEGNPWKPTLVAPGVYRLPS